MDKLEVLAFEGKASPVFDHFKARLDENGKFTFGYNNFYFKVMLAEPDDDRMMKMQLRGEQFALRIADENDRQRFLELCKAHTDFFRPVMNDNSKKTEALLSDECNARLWEMYKIAQKNGISHNDLCG